MMRIEDAIVFINIKFGKMFARQTNWPQVEIPAYSDMSFFISIPASAIF
jgi:hypothetical protein